MFDKPHAHRAYKCKNAKMQKFQTVHQSGKMSKQRQQMLSHEKGLSWCIFLWMAKKTNGMKQKKIWR